MTAGSLPVVFLERLTKRAPAMAETRIARVVIQVDGADVDELTNKHPLVSPLESIIGHSWRLGEPLN